jgi:hypothetical protein
MMGFCADRRAVFRGLARAAVLPAAAFAVHQLRYLLAYGGGASVELQRQGHTYLHSLVPWIVLALGLAAGAFVSALGRAMAGQRSLPRFGVSLIGLWLTCSACLLAVYAVQELLEGMFVIGHPAGLAGIFGYGGWWAIPASLCVGLIMATLLHGARWVLDEVAARFGCSLVRRQLAPSSPRPVSVPAPRLAPLAAGWCGRGPPRRRVAPAAL